ncbi:hypothetical protein M8C21_002387 [Ambrosia artemisiifolia]|uniref:Uncharacterized protein n=1 Tax=Ambrosia artemisiifolia TaxID=4212 RepID=A0AAD5C6U8_AMBAR|nr:hypothetical protein M8C21_002387 [Ambrosia artemisiifolia]
MVALPMETTTGTCFLQHYIDIADPDLKINHGDKASSGIIEKIVAVIQDPTELHVVTELYSWGSGVSYQSGTGNARIQKLPCKVDSLHGSLLPS